MDPSQPVSKKIKLSEFVDEKSEARVLEHIQDEDADRTRETNGNDEPHILQSFTYTKDFPNVTQRYLTPYYFVDEKTPGDDICILVHSNRICMISLAPSHDIIKLKKTLKSISFKVSDKLDRASNKVSGKGKHGAQPLQPSSNICSIECEGGEIYLIKCNMTGKLVEVNDSLIQRPNLLFQPPHKGGYLAIALPNIHRFEEMKKELLDQEAYDALQQRINGNDKCSTER